MQLLDSMDAAGKPSATAASPLVPLPPGFLDALAAAQDPDTLGACLESSGGSLGLVVQATLFAAAPAYMPECKVLLRFSTVPVMRSSCLLGTSCRGCCCGRGMLAAGPSGVLAAMRLGGDSAS
jgi:hypothetical protein